MKYSVIKHDLTRCRKKIFQVVQGLSQTDQGPKKCSSGDKQEKENGPLGSQTGHGQTGCL